MQTVIAKIKERLDELDWLIGTTPPDQDDEYFSAQINEYVELNELLDRLTAKREPCEV